MSVTIPQALPPRSGTLTSDPTARDSRLSGTEYVNGRSIPLNSRIVAARFSAAILLLRAFGGGRRVQFGDFAEYVRIGAQNARARG